MVRRLKQRLQFISGEAEVRMVASLPFITLTQEEVSKVFQSEDDEDE